MQEQNSTTSAVRGGQDPANEGDPVFCEPKIEPLPLTMVGSNSNGLNRSRLPFAGFLKSSLSEGLLVLASSHERSPCSAGYNRIYQLEVLSVCLRV